MEAFKAKANGLSLPSPHEEGTGESGAALSGGAGVLRRGNGREANAAAPPPTSDPGADAEEAVEQEGPFPAAGMGTDTSAARDRDDDNPGGDRLPKDSLEALPEALPEALQGGRDVVDARPASPARSLEHPEPKRNPAAGAAGARPAALVEEPEEEELPEAGLGAEVAGEGAVPAATQEAEEGSGAAPRKGPRGRPRRDPNAPVVPKKVGAVVEAPSSSSSDEAEEDDDPPKWPVGTIFFKHFVKHGDYQGRVIAIRRRAAAGKIYRVKYSDGDIEDITPDDLDACVVVEVPADPSNQEQGRGHRGRKRAFQPDEELFNAVIPRYAPPKRKDSNPREQGKGGDLRPASSASPVAIGRAAASVTPTRKVQSKPGKDRKALIAANPILMTERCGIHGARGPCMRKKHACPYHHHLDGTVTDGDDAGRETGEQVVSFQEAEASLAGMEAASAVAGAEAAVAEAAAAPDGGGQEPEPPPKKRGRPKTQAMPRAVGEPVVPLQKRPKPPQSEHEAKGRAGDEDAIIEDEEERERRVAESKEGPLEPEMKPEMVAGATMEKKKKPARKKGEGGKPRKAEKTHTGKRENMEGLPMGYAVAADGFSAGPMGVSWGEQAMAGMLGHHSMQGLLEQGVDGPPQGVYGALPGIYEGSVQGMMQMGYAAAAAAAAAGGFLMPTVVDGSGMGGGAMHHHHHHHHHHQGHGVMGQAGGMPTSGMFHLKGLAGMPVAYHGGYHGGGPAMMQFGMAGVAAHGGMGHGDRQPMVVYMDPQQNGS